MDLDRISQHFSIIQIVVTFWLPVGYQVARTICSFQVVAFSKPKSLLTKAFKVASALAFDSQTRASNRLLMRMNLQNPYPHCSINDDSNHYAEIHCVGIAQEKRNTRRMQNATN